GSGGREILRWQKIHLPPVFPVAGTLRPRDALNDDSINRDAQRRHPTTSPIPLYKLTLTYLC
ncbi:MAG: hypothetical protein MI802_04305, partial [Desulfobacterales bacterium]|nr:hypothetical protein [Desulfobacterales bacterium]